VAQRVGRGIALLFHRRGTRKGVSGQQHAPAAIYPRERPGTHCIGGWVWTGGKSRPHRDSIPDRPARNQSLYTARLEKRNLLGLNLNSKFVVFLLTMAFQYFTFKLSMFKYFTLQSSFKGC